MLGFMRRHSGNLLSKIRGMRSNTLRGAAIGAITGGIGSGISGGNIFSGAMSGALWGGGASLAGNAAAGKWGNKKWGAPGKVQDAVQLRHALGDDGFKNVWMGYSTSQRNLPYKTVSNLSVGGKGGSITFGSINSNKAFYASAKISTIAGVAGGLIGASGRDKGYATMNSNMGSSSMGGYGGGGYY